MWSCLIPELAMADLFNQGMLCRFVFFYSVCKGKEKVCVKSLTSWRAASLKSQF